MQWSQVVPCKFGACNEWEKISSLVELSIEEGICTGTGCWFWTVAGWSRARVSRTVRPGTQASAWHACMSCPGTTERKQGTERFSQLFSYVAGLCLRELSCASLEYLKFRSNFSPNRMDPGFAKRLFQRTYDSWYDNSHNKWHKLKLQLLSIMKFPKAWKAREAAKRRQFELRRLAAGFLQRTEISQYF